MLHVHHFTIAPFARLYGLALKCQQDALKRRARESARASGSAATLYRVRVPLRWFLERWAARRLDDAGVEGDYCVIWVNTVPVVLQQAMMMRALNASHGWG